MKKKAEDSGKTYTAEDHRYVQMKRQHKLFGNIEFIGELYLCHLLRPDTVKSIFEHLLHMDCFMDDTVEAALRFIEKVGPTIEERMSASEGIKRKISAEDYEVILNKFKKIWQDSDTSEAGTRTVGKRIQKLAQNMLENQALGWKKLKQKDTDVKTKD